MTDYRLQNYISKIRTELVPALFGLLLQPWLNHCAIQRNKIVATSNRGQFYGDNPKYIIQELLKRSDNLDIVWLVDGSKPKYELPNRVRAVDIRSVAAIVEFATARIWIDNTRARRYVRKKPGQFYIQTWHGMLGPKRSEGAATKSFSRIGIKTAMADAAETNLMFANNDIMLRLYQESYWYDGPVIRCGIPRNESLLSKSYSIIREQTRKQLSVGSRLLCLYAPTFRNDFDPTRYQLNWSALRGALQDRFGKECVIAIRLHPNIAAQSIFNRSHEVIDVSLFPDCQSLLTASDVLISDYSSIAEDFGLMKKPGYLYMPDLDDYLEERGFNYPFDMRPFPYAKTEGQLLNLIRDVGDAELESKRAAFYKFAGLKDEGNGAQQLADIVQFVLNNPDRNSFSLEILQGIADGSRDEQLF